MDLPFESEHKWKVAPFPRFSDGKVGRGHVTIVLAKARQKADTNQGWADCSDTDCRPQDRLGRASGRWLATCRCLRGQRGRRLVACILIDSVGRSQIQGPVARARWAGEDWGLGVGEQRCA